MVESQSRYSIVERLTQRKLEIMNAKSELKEDVQEKQQKIGELEKDLINWERDVGEDVKREKRKKERAIEHAKKDYDNLKGRLDEREKVYNSQIKAVEEALESVEEISKTSPTIQGKS